MSVILIDMDMPNSCYECRLKNRCEYALANGWLGNKRDENCPLRPYKERKMEWIPVTERLPEEDGDYLVTTSSFYGTTIFVTTRYFSDGEWTYDRAVTAWMPLPTPYEVATKLQDGCKEGAETEIKNYLETIVGSKGGITQ